MRYYERVRHDGRVTGNEYNNNSERKKYSLRLCRVCNIYYNMYRWYRRRHVFIEQTTFASPEEIRGHHSNIVIDLKYTEKKNNKK